MKRSAILAACGVLLLAIGCQQGSDQGATTTTTPLTTTPTTTTPPAENTTAASNAPAGQTGFAPVQAAFNQNCMPCHSAKAHRNGLDLTSYETAMKGGEHGALVVPGNPDKSLLVQYLTGAKQPRMPQKRAPLTADQMKVITDWIKAGAKKA